MPELLEVNVDAIKVWQLVNNQLILSPSGQIVGINHLAIWEIIDRYKIKRPLYVFEKILTLSNTFYEKENAG